MNFLPFADREFQPAKLVPQTANSNAPRQSSLAFLLLATFFGTLVGITLYEVVKTAWSPTLIGWESHAMTIAVVSLLAPAIAFFVFRKQSAQLQTELNEDESAQAAVLEAKDTTEQASQAKSEFVATMKPPAASGPAAAPSGKQPVIAGLFRNSAAIATDEHPQNDAECPAFDAEAALDRVEGDRELLGKMVGLFAMQWRKLSAEIAKAGQHRDGATMELTAHKLKQSVETFGADEASRLAQELQARGRKGDFGDAEKICARLKMEIERLVNALEVFSKEMVPCPS